MKFTSLAIAAVAALVAIAPAQAVSISGGNPVIDRESVDSFYNFSILDGTNPITAKGKLTSWSIFAPAGGSGVALLIYRANGLQIRLVGSSAVE